MAVYTMLAIQIGILIVIAILFISAYDYWVVFSESPRANWYLGVTAASLLIAVKVLYDRFTAEVVSERQFPKNIKDALAP